MGFSYAARTMASLAIRQQATDSNLARTMNLSSVVGGLSNPVSSDAPGADPGFWGSLWKNTKNLIAGAAKLVAKIVGFSCQKLVDWTFRAIGFLWRFDWNIQTKQVDAIQSQALLNIAGIVGGALGQLTGVVVGGVIPGLVLLKFNKALGLHALKELKDEALDDIAGELSRALTATAANLGRVAALRAYVGLRNAAGPAWVAGLKKLQKAGIVGADTVKNAENAVNNTDGVVSLQRKYQNGVEKLPEWQQEFIEEFVEEFSDSTRDCMLIIAGAVDSFYAQSATMELDEARQAVLEIDFNRDSKENPDPDTST